MKWIYILLIGALLLCSSGIASAANKTVDMSKMVDMNEVKKEAGNFWKSANANGNTGNVVISMFLVGFIAVVFVALLIGGGKSAAGKKTENANSTKEGRDGITSAVTAVIYVVVAIMVIGVFLSML